MSKNLVKNIWYKEKGTTFPDYASLLEKGKKKHDVQTFFGGFTNPIGIEIEVEKIQSPGTNFIFWDVDTDNSLKISGLEFISKPLAGRCIDYALAEFANEIKDQSCLWSHRTSIHVHNNVSNLTEDQLSAFVVCYAALEALFFSLVEDHRKGSPYCYHLTDTDPRRLVFGDYDSKYCAFNVGNCLREHNTIEFRHMQGTQDMKQIRRWIQLIVKLHSYINRTDPAEVIKRVLRLNTAQDYSAFVLEVFKSSAVLFRNLDLPRVMESGVTWAKVYNLVKEDAL